MPAPFGCPEAILDPVQYTLSQAPFFVSLDMTVARKFDVEEWRLNNHMSSVQEATLRNSQSAGGEAREMFQFVPETTGLKKRECGFLDLKCGIVNMVKGGLNSAYGKARRRAETRFVNDVQRRADLGAEYTGNAIEDARGDLRTLIEDHAREHVQETLDRDDDQPECQNNTQ